MLADNATASNEKAANAPAAFPVVRLARTLAGGFERLIRAA